MGEGGGGGKPPEFRIFVRREARRLGGGLGGYFGSEGRGFEEDCLLLLLLLFELKSNPLLASFVVVVVVTVVVAVAVAVAVVQPWCFLILLTSVVTPLQLLPSESGMPSTVSHISSNCSPQVSSFTSFTCSASFDTYNRTLLAYLLLNGHKKE